MVSQTTNAPESDKDVILPEPQTNAQPEPYLKHFKDKEISKFVDPCAHATKASLDCMNKHEYDRDKCLDYFQAYRDCKKAWMDQRRADRRAGKKVD